MPFPDASASVHHNVIRSRFSIGSGYDGLIRELDHGTREYVVFLSTLDMSGVLVIERKPTRIAGVANISQFNNKYSKAFFGQVA